ncbi:hypothetical protein SDC9_127122 [bioreactor metagenome]|uniref:Uncharacterized protein n=1 Tax=bioreactor metagenome TaxID=1076179 RepID=A0A645CSI6_9ZZZZ
MVVNAHQIITGRGESIGQFIGGGLVMVTCGKTQCRAIETDRFVRLVFKGEKSLRSNDHPPFFSGRSVVEKREIQRTALDDIAFEIQLDPLPSGPGSDLFSRFREKTDRLRRERHGGDPPERFPIRRAENERDKRLLRQREAGGEQHLIPFLILPTGQCVFQRNGKRLVADVPPRVNTDRLPGAVGVEGFDHTDFRHPVKGNPLRRMQQIERTGFDGGAEVDPAF